MTVQQQQSPSHGLATVVPSPWIWDLDLSCSSSPLLCDFALRQPQRSRASLRLEYLPYLHFPGSWTARVLASGCLSSCHGFFHLAPVIRDTLPCHYVPSAAILRPAASRRLPLSWSDPQAAPARRPRPPREGPPIQTHPIPNEEKTLRPRGRGSTRFNSNASTPTTLASERLRCEQPFHQPRENQQLKRSTAPTNPVKR